MAEGRRPRKKGTNQFRSNNEHNLFIVYRFIYETEIDPLPIAGDDLKMFALAFNIDHSVRASMEAIRTALKKTKVLWWYFFSIF